MIKIAIVTATRAEYGLLNPVIRKLRSYETSDLKVEVIVTGTHLKKQYGNTIREIQEDQIRIDHRIEIPVESQTEEDISQNQADTLVKFTRLFLEQRYEAVVLLGDRYETLAIAIAAGNTQTPVFHMCGGDTTEGAIDEWIRHAITKISYLHFPTNKESAKRVVQLGENPQRVFNYGSTSIDNIINIATLSKAEVLKSIGLKECRYFICTYHPVTMEEKNVDSLLEEFFAVIKNFSNYTFIVTKSNADQGGARINQLLDEASMELENLHVYESLGVKRYLSLMKYSEAVVGNSSSGIIEAPAFYIPTVNIGDRQKGRLRTKSIIDCGIYREDIIRAINRAMSSDFRAQCKEIYPPYGDGHAAEKIAKKMIETIQSGKIDLKKKFYDL